MSARFLVAVLLAPEVILAPLLPPLVLLDAAEIIIAAAAIALLMKILVAVHFLWPFAVIVEGGTWGLPSAEGAVSFCISGTWCVQMPWHGASSRRSRMTKSSCRVPGEWKRDCNPSRSTAAMEGLR